MPFHGRASRGDFAWGNCAASRARKPRIGAQGCPHCLRS